MKKFDEELDALRRRLMQMGAVAESMVGRSMGALVDRQAGPIAEVMADERALDRFNVEIDNEAVRLLTVYSPVARDLRFLLMASRINSELERIGDQAVNMCEQIEVLIAQPPLKPLIDLPRMAELATGMVHRALEALVERDALKAKEVIDTDDRVDELNDQIFRELLTYVASAPENLQRAVALIFTARALERIADHATNIGEEVIYMVLGKDIRHAERPQPVSRR